MHKKQIKTLNDLLLDDYEQELEDFLNKGTYKSTKNLNALNTLFKEAVQHTNELKKSKSITLRIKQADLIKVKAKAQENNIAYQTLISLLIHQYVVGKRTVFL